MAALKLADLAKRNNAEIIINRVKNKIPFTHVITKEQIVPITLLLNKNKSIEPQKTELIQANKVEIEDVNGNVHNITKLYKDAELAGRKKDKPFDKSQSERQERGLVNAINECVLISNSSGLLIEGLSNNFIIKASKKEGLSDIGQEPYIDVELFTYKTKIGASLKDINAPSLAGGGLKGLITIDKPLIDTLHYKTIEHLTSLGFQNFQYYNSKIVPDVYALIPQSNILKILKGTSEMGGPVDYMYIGNMDVEWEYNGEKLIFTNGSFYDINEYAEKYTFYFRLRKRDILNNLIFIDYDNLNSSGYPNIFRQQENGMCCSRWVIEKRVPDNIQPIGLT